MSWELLKSIDHKDEKYKNHMIKALHNILPTKSKICKRVKKKVSSNLINDTNNRYWQDKYPHIKDELCVFCKEEPETTKHLTTCKSKYVQSQLSKAYHKICRKTKGKAFWFFTGLELEEKERLGTMPRLFGNMGLIPNQLSSYLLKNIKNAKAVKDISSSIQKTLVKTHLNIWKHRNAVLYGKAHKAIT